MMQSNCDEGGGRKRKSALVAGFLTMALFAGSANLWAATDTSSDTSARSYATLYLNSATPENTGNQIVTALRNMFPQAKIYFVPAENAISVMATPDDLQMARKMLTELDQAKKSYRLTYTITDAQGQVRRTTLVIVPGETAELKEGTRVPVVTGTEGGAGAPAKNDVQYLDVGLMIKASLYGSADHLRLRSRVEQSGEAEQQSSLGTQDPVIRQTSMDGTVALEEGKPTTLGSLDMPGGKGHMQIAVTAEAIE